MKTEFTNFREEAKKNLFADKIVYVVSQIARLFEEDPEIIPGVDGGFIANFKSFFFETYIDSSKCKTREFNRARNNKNCKTCDEFSNFKE